MKTYVGVLVVSAEPVQKGRVYYYRVTYADGHVSLMPKVTFDALFRETTAEEAHLIKQELVD